MTTFQTLAHGFRADYRLNIRSEDHSLVAIQRKKYCLCSCALSQEIKKEREAAQEALTWLDTHNAADEESNKDFRSLYRGVSNRLKSVKKMNHGFLGWLMSLFRSTKTNQELKKLETTLCQLQKVMQKGDRVRQSILSQIQSSDTSESNESLFKQVATEMPDLVASKMPAPSDFGVTATNLEPNKPFLLLKNKHSAGYTVCLPPVTVHSTSETISLSTLRKLPQALQVHQQQSQLRQQQNQRANLFNACVRANAQLNDSTGGNHLLKRDKLNLTLFNDVNNPRIIALYINPLLNKWESAELALDDTQTLDSLLAWTQQLMTAHQARLVQHEARIERYRAHGIQATEEGLMAEGIFEAGLTEESFNRIRSLITQKQSNDEFYRNSWPLIKENKKIDYGLSIVEIENSKLLYYIRDSNGNLVCRVHKAKQNLNLRITLEIEKRFPFALGCIDLLTDKDIKDRLLVQVRRNPNPSREDVENYAQIVNLTWRIEGREIYLNASYWNPEKDEDEVVHLELTPETTLDHVRAWIEQLKMTNYQRAQRT